MGAPKFEIPNSQFQIPGSLLIKNTAINFIGQVIPLLAALVTIPYIVHGLGTERFGIFSLTFVVLGYFSIFDLGLGRATTKFVAEALGKGETERILTILWTSLGFISILGIIGGAILIALTPLLVERVLNVPSYLIEEAKLVFYILSVSILIALITATLSGVLEAYQRFDLVNTLRIPSNILTYVIPAAALFFRANLPFIVRLLVIKNFGMLLLYFFYCIKIIPSIRLFFSINSKVVRPLFNFGAWIALNNAAVSILLYLDRFLVGVFLTMSAVTYYTVPYELVNRALILPSSVTMVLFPAFSSLEVIDRDKLQNLFIRALKYLTLIMGLIIGVIFVFSREILLYWLGSEFAEKGTTVLQLLSIGVFLSSLAWLSGTLLQGIGHPKIVSITQFPQVPIYVLLTWLLIKRVGIEGAALAWTLHKLITFFWLLLIITKLRFFEPIVVLKRTLLKPIIVIILATIFSLIVRSLSAYFSINVIISILFVIICSVVISWSFIFSYDKDMFLKDRR